MWNSEFVLFCFVLFFFVLFCFVVVCFFLCDGECTCPFTHFPQMANNQLEFLEDMRSYCTENRKASLVIYNKLKHAANDDEFHRWFAKSCLYSVQCYTHLHNLNKDKYEASYKRLASALIEFLGAIEERCEKEDLEEDAYLRVANGLKSRKDNIEETAADITKAHLWKES